MSGWMGWLGGGSGGGTAVSKKKEAPKNAILGLRSTMEMLNKREKHLQLQIDEQDALARKNVNTNKTAAKLALRRKKGFEHTLEQTSASMMTVEREIASIETANINKETMDAMKNAGLALKQIHAGLTVDKVDQTMEDLREQHAVGEEIATALSEGGTGLGTMDDAELDEELEGLQQEMLDEKMSSPGLVPQADQIQRMPTPARGEIKSRTPVYEEEDDEEAQLKKLQADMAM